MQKSKAHSVFHAHTCHRLLSAAFEKKGKDDSAGSIDIKTEPKGKQNGTAPLQDALSSDKNTETSVCEQAEGAGIQELRTEDCELYWFVSGGEIYLDDTKLDPEALVHEYAHLWDEALKKLNPELWSRGKELMRGTELWREIEGSDAYGKKWKEQSKYGRKRIRVHPWSRTLADADALCRDIEAGRRLRDPCSPHI